MNKLFVFISIFSFIFENSHQVSRPKNVSTTSVDNDLRQLMNLKRSFIENQGSSCVININKDHMLLEKNLHDKWPLVLTSNDQPNFVNVDKNGDIALKLGQKLRLVCTGDRNRFVNIRANVPDIIVSCNRGKFFDYMGSLVNFEEFGCAFVPDSVDKIIGDNHHQIGFRLPNDQFIPLIDIHYDSNIEVINVTHKLPYVDFRKYQKIDRIPFRDGNHPLGRGIDRFYQRKNIYGDMVELLGDKNARKYFNEGSFITKGHMAPKSDFIFGAQQLATFFYMNINPQFSGLNNINWNFLEMSIRNTDFGDIATIHTGSSRILQLPSKVSGINETIFLGPSSTLPIPEIFWKIVEVGYDKFSFIGLNYPSIETQEFLWKVDICKDLCETEDYSWLDQKLKKPSSRYNFSKGFMLCCSYEEIEDFINQSIRR